VIAEFPFGSEPWELRYMIGALEHRHRLVNGFSGALPASYRERRLALRALLGDPDRAWQELRSSGATHALVHEGAWGLPQKGRRASRWLEEHGARRVAEAGTDALFELPR
jgi:hypothetical protein